MKYVLVIVIIGLGIGIFLHMTDASEYISAIISDTLGINNTNINISPLDAPPPKKDQWTITQKVKSAQELLRTSPDLRIDERDRNSLIRNEISLAILDTQTGDIFERRYWLDGDEIDQANSVRRAYGLNPVNLPSFINADEHDDFMIVVNWWNNFNSDLSALEVSIRDDEVVINKTPSRYIVVANKFLMPNDSLAYPEDRTGVRYSDIVYTPYSKSLITDESVSGGQGYISVIIDQAFYELRAANIISKAFPGNLVVDTITPNFMKNLVLTEQTDPKLIFSADDGGLELAKRVLVRLDTNRDRTFRFTVSKTGASGPAQIMPGTYNSIVNGYPDAKLIRDTDIGRVDMVNALKASILVFDDHLATVIRRVNRSASARAIFNAKTKDEIDVIRGAIYNGGSSKYIPATGQISQRVTETVEFVKKFKMIRALEMFE
jgi:hypothetical protein